ncbi:MAG: putative quinol monooxygenase [Thermodesulfobacteriota bacterium]
MLIVIAKFRTKPECRKNMIEMSREMLEPSRREDGCISYEFLHDPFDPDSFTFYEKWRSRKDLDLHFETPHFKDFEHTFPDLIDGPENVVAYEVASENVLA